VSGWVDFYDAVRTTRLKDGSYLVFVDEDWKAKVMAHQSGEHISNENIIKYTIRNILIYVMIII
jgi:hypothetical protein